MIEFALLIFKDLCKVVLTQLSHMIYELALLMWFPEMLRISIYNYQD